MKDYVVSLRDQDLAFWSDEDKNFTPNIFRATKAEQNEATALVVKMKAAGVEACTELLIVAAKRYQELTEPQG